MKKTTVLAVTFIAGTLLASAGISWLTCRLNAPVVAAFNMKSTVDAFFESATRRSLDEAQTKVLSERFNAALEASLQVGRPVTTASSWWRRRWCRALRTSPAISRRMWPAG